MTYYDKYGREIKEGDVLKVFHFTAARRRQQIFMYKLVMAGDSRGNLIAGGPYLYGVDCEEVARGMLPQVASRYSIRQDQLFSEIVDGGTVRDDDLWWERPKRKQ